MSGRGRTAARAHRYAPLALVHVHLLRAHLATRTNESTAKAKACERAGRLVDGTACGRWVMGREGGAHLLCVEVDADEEELSPVRESTSIIGAASDCADAAPITVATGRARRCLARGTGMDAQAAARRTCAGSNRTIAREATCARAGGRACVHTVIAAAAAVHPRARGWAREGIQARFFGSGTPAAAAASRPLRPPAAASRRPCVT